MATVKPAKFCKLEKGKILDAQEGFVATFNWMASFLDDLTRGATAKIEEVKIVTGTKYDTTSHKFVQTTRKARVIVLESYGQDGTVFEATPFSGEL